MREILFRGKRICEKKNWVEGCLLNMDEDSGHVFIVPFFCNASTIPISRLVEYTSAYVNPKTVGQFTGLFDKNGKRIFEGDILKIYDDHIVKVIFADGSFYVEDNIIYDPAYHYENAACEVIGNIHDNPELLEV